ncbi:DUF6438 domain-containing protein [Nitrosopumilus ureiphilus]|uniref:DUF6438 domain-containing protein n=1 Tax=Nitrosopumilus ureiphilus TaxID=1470067 RepID=A0A7D5RCT8_9ARCH|nr:DUF6438 domain-containing protein [Nitrosopumilus ureiphilus]QLH06141.1 hypothetical protein C5F50_02905 [Nitrosopumilus ureiphilus]
MKTRLLIIITMITTVFLLVAVVYPTINYRTWGNNELFYALPPPGMKIICDEWLWQPPQNCRPVYVIQDTDIANVTIIPNAIPKITNLDNIMITMERHPCFGPCPAYSLTIHGNGTVDYDGFSFVNPLGKKTIHISPDTVAELVGRFYEIDYFLLDDRYESPVDDSSAVSTTITIGNYSKSVYNYAKKGPEKLQSLEKMIDDATISSLPWDDIDPEKHRSIEE